MRRSLQSCCGSYLLLTLGLLLHCDSGEAMVQTEIQQGPLYRVVGSSLSISCNTSGFSNAGATQDFEFRTRKPSRPNLDINIISTKDPTFPYAVYSPRVRGNEITLKHLSETSVLFEIQSLTKEDEGEYECTVINSEYTYLGTYSASTTVKVIDNSLSVSSPASDSLSYEGDALTLTCQASSNTVQHTHLSLHWYLQKEGVDNPQPIISLDRDFTLIPGQGFEGRYRAGLIRLDKMGEAMYRLKMARLELSDQGRIYCRAQEWIQEPDRSWFSIAQKDSEKSSLNMKAREVVTDMTSLAVRIVAQPTSLHEGQELTLSCNVDMQNLQERFFSVAWFRGSAELARIGPTGILSVGTEYSGREEGGELRVGRIRDRDYRLVLQPVRTEDQGEYFCKAWPQERGQDGAFTQGTAQDSSTEVVSISATESGLSVSMEESVSVNEGGKLMLTCKVQGVKDQLSVTWQHKSASTSTGAWTNIISLSQEGVMEAAEMFRSRTVKATRPATDSFTLELDEVTPSDAGAYQCDVSEWKANSKTKSESQSATVTVTPVDSLLKVRLISRNSAVTVGGDVELMCRVKGPRLPITVTWSVQRGGSTLDNILTLYHDGGISWSGEQHSYQLKVQTRGNEVTHSLLINGASQREAGNYQCSVSPFLENVNKKPTSSNPVAVSVTNPENKLSLTSTPALTTDANTDVVLRCSVVSEPSVSSRYAVTWLFDNETVVSSDQDAYVTFGVHVGPGRRQRIGVRRTKGPTFELSIRQVLMSDRGSYVCEVVEWLQDPRGDWYQLSPATRTTVLTVNEPTNNLRLQRQEQSLVAKETDNVELRCTITSGASSSFFYKVAWLYTPINSSTTEVLVELDHTGLLRYPQNEALRGLQGRLRLRRPTLGGFYLGIQRAHEGDSGAYRCQVEQYQKDHEGQWQQKASDSADPITLTVKVEDKKLTVLKEDVDLNATLYQDFAIPCRISRKSSSESELQVTWFSQKEGETNLRPIFTVYRNSTLQDRFWKRDQLRFSHPLPDQYSLTVSRPAPEDSGVYFCEVEEWLPSLSRGWRKAAVEKSGYLTVSVYSKDDVKALSECQSSTWIGIFVAFAVCALLVIFLLVVKICRGKASGGKPAPSLWTEQPLMNTKPRVED